MAIEMPKQTLETRQGHQPTGISRFRPPSSPMSARSSDLEAQLTAKAMELEQLIAQAAPSRYTSLALTALEEAVLWAAKGLSA